mgnify:FL=1
MNQFESIIIKIMVKRSIFNTRKCGKYKNKEIVFHLPDQNADQVENR